MNATEAQQALRKASDPQRAKFVARYFKTGKGEYGEGDQFLGITVPIQREIAHQFLDLTLTEINKLLKSDTHEDRFVALEILVAQFERASTTAKKQIVNFYLKNTKYINNWDLVDTSAPYILGPYFFEYPGKCTTLFKLAKSKNFWERRIAIISTLFFVGKMRFDETLRLATMLLYDSHDLIHKSVGWALREVGKRNPPTLRFFLGQHATHMPRTMLRYSLERFDSTLRREYMTMR